MRNVLLHPKELSVLRYVESAETMLATSGDRLSSVCEQLMAYGFLDQQNGRWVLTDLGRRTVLRTAAAGDGVCVEVPAADLV